MENNKNLHKIEKRIRSIRSLLVLIIALNAFTIIIDYPFDFIEGKIDFNNLVIFCLLVILGCSIGCILILISMMLLKLKRN